MRAGRRGLLREAIASRKGVEPDYNDPGGRESQETYTLK